MKHIISFYLLLFLFGFTPNSQEDSDLAFNDKGIFKIVQFTDTHVSLEKNANLNVYGIVADVLAVEKPDFAILTGDVVTETNPREGYRRFAEVFQKAKVPWAVVFGNHDSENSMTRKDIADFLQSLPYCMNRDRGETEGNTNFVLPVFGRDKKIAALLYCMDSNTYSTLKPTVDGYGWFTFSQIEWYRNKSSEYTQAHGGPLPALAFFHIPLPEYTAAWNNEATPPVGVKNEPECSPDINTGMFAAMLECGDVMGTFVGHDHINDYIGRYYDIALAYGRVSKVMRGAEDPLAGGRVIVLKEDARSFDTWIRDMHGKKELECNWPESFRTGAE
jgi:hypothetical protein